MIHVIAAIRVVEGKLPEYLEIVRDTMVRVRAERGCIEYSPAVDIGTDVPSQSLDGHVVTIIEKWDSLESLHDHLRSPHMLAYREKVRDMVEGISLKILKDA